MEKKKEVYAVYNEKCIRVYQAYNPVIANEAVALQTFGEHFRLNRMTWIKPSFLWMMYRSRWGTGKDQERILALDIYRDTFDHLLQKAVLSAPDLSVYRSYAHWKKIFQESEVCCQWDPDKDIHGISAGRPAIQIGIKGDTLIGFVEHGISHIEDITAQVAQWRELRNHGLLNPEEVPQEQVYPMEDPMIRERLGMK